MRNLFVTALMLLAIGVCFAFTDWPMSTTRKPSPSPEPPAPPRTSNRESIAELHFIRGEYKEAADAYRRIVEEQPENAIAWARLSFATHALGDFEAAVAVHEQAATFDENRVASLFKLGCALARLDRPEEALEAIDQAIEAGYRNRARAEQEADLASLREDERFQLLLDRMGPPRPGASPLDFWTGNWSIRNPENGALFGTASVMRVDNGHLFDERWTDFRGVSSWSLTYLDPSDGLWKMVRVSNQGEVYRLEGTVEDGRLELSGTCIRPSGRESRARMILEPVNMGRVKQRFLDLEGEEGPWKTRHDLLLMREEPTWFGRNRLR